MIDSNETDDAFYQGDPVGSGFFRSFLQEFVPQKRRQVAILVSVFVLVVAALAVGVIVFTSMSQKPQSYRDGFTAGGAVYAEDSTAQVGARQACRATEQLRPGYGGLPRGENASQWMTGCIAAFESAQDGT